MRMTIFAALAVAVLVCLFAQSPNGDPGGWTKATWGMTSDQIMAVFPQATQIDIRTPQEKELAEKYSLPIHQTELGLPSYSVQGRKYTVAFLFDKQGHLSSVRLIYMKVLISPDGTEVPLACESCTASASPQAKQSRSARNKANADTARNEIVKAALNEQIVNDAKETLLTGLKDKYGNPTSHTPVADGDTEYFEWLFPTTKISLAWFHSQFKELNSVDLFYSVRKKSSEL